MVQGQEDPPVVVEVSPHVFDDWAELYWHLRKLAGTLGLHPTDQMRIDSVRCRDHLEAVLEEFGLGRHRGQLDPKITT